MNPMHPPHIRAYHTRRFTVYHDASVSLESAVEILQEPGETIKSSSKAFTRRVGRWLVKESRGGSLSEVFKHVTKPERYRAVWSTSLALRERGVPIPMPLAYFERKLLRRTISHAYICEFMRGYVSVEDYARSLGGHHANPDAVNQFLSRLALALRQLEAAGGYHADLSGKNILTTDGEQFVFVDLDAMSLVNTIDENMRLKNHVQLYDSFCDQWTTEYLTPFLASLLPDTLRADAWMPQVWKGQRERRARSEAIWRREGRPPQRFFPA